MWTWYGRGIGRAWSDGTSGRAARRFNQRDLIDLACWSNLAWMHPLAFERDAELAVQAIEQRAVGFAAGRDGDQLRQRWTADDAKLFIKG